MKNFRILLVASTALLTANFALAQTWTQTSAPDNNWQSVASSADGVKLVAVAANIFDPLHPPASPVYVSTNSGVTWTPTDLENIPDGFIWSWNSIASSADGGKLVAASFTYPLHVSADSGTTWTETGPQFNPNLYWIGVASSADGNKLVALRSNGSAINNGMIYTSMDSGTTWTNVNSTLNECGSIASSSDGSKLVASIMDDAIYISTNSGTTWSATELTDILWWSVACSSDGSKIVAGRFLAGPIYTSADSGVCWTLTSAPNTNWQSIASSADGCKLVAAVYGGQIYTSIDSGKTWIAADAPSTNWNSVACSADGNEQVATIRGSGIWISHTAPSPHLNITPTNGNLTVCWIIPSTNFVLQQNLDLTTTNWTDVTNEPVLNLTNLQDEVVLSPTNSSGFYRLKTQ